jgi:hypothetical protein
LNFRLRIANKNAIEILEKNKVVFEPGRIDAGNVPGEPDSG